MPIEGDELLLAESSDTLTETPTIDTDLLKIMGLGNLPEKWNVEAEKDDIKEATKDYFDRRQEMSKALQDPNSLEMKESRSLATNLSAAVHSTQGQLPAITDQLNTLGEVMQSMTSSIAEPTLPNVVTALASFSGHFDSDGGIDDLSRKRTVDEYKPGDGKMRKDAQSVLVRAQGTLLFLADDLFKSGDMPGAIEVLKNARFRDVVTGRDSWLTDSIAQAAEQVDLDRDDQRAAILELRHVGYNLHQSQVEDISRRGENPPLGSYDRVSMKISEAVKVEEKIKEERRRIEQKEKYEAAMKEEYSRFTDAHVREGQNALQNLFESGQYQSPNFRRDGGGHTMIGSALEKDFNLQDKLHYNDLRGTQGYLDILQNLSENSDLFEQVVTSNVDSMFYDLGMRSKDDYEQANQIEAFRDHVRTLTRTEIYARTLGFLEGALIYGPEGSRGDAPKNMFDQQRTEIVSRCLEILGGGHALDSFLVGKGLNPEAQVVRTRLDAFIKLPLNHYDTVDYGSRTSGRNDEYYQQLIKIRQPRLQIMANAARKADLAVAERTEERSQAVLVEQKRKEKRRTELAKSAEEARANLDATTAFIEELQAAKGAVRELDTIYEEADDQIVPKLIAINPKDTQDPNARIWLSIVENPREITRVAEEIAKNEHALESRPANASEIRELLSSLRVRQRILTELDQSLVPLNTSTAQAEKSKKTGLGGLGKPMRIAAIAAKIFDSPSDRRTGNRRWFNGSNELDTRVKAIQNPQKGYGKEDAQVEPLSQIREALENAMKTEDILTQEAAINQLSRQAQARKSLAEQSAVEARATITTCIRNTASHLGTDRLYAVLQNQGRINWK